MQPHPLLRFLASALFASLLGLVWWLDHRAPARARHGSGSVSVRFEEVSERSGIRFRHAAPRLDPRLANVEPHVAALGASVAVGDFDADGWPDLYATSSAFGAPNALFHNRRDGTFADVAAEAGVAELNREGEGVSMGALWADYDNDGLEDLFVHRWGWQALFHNAGGGRFREVSAESGLRVWMNSNGACWLDYDRDGLVDLYVAGYFSEKHDLWHLETTRIMQESFEFARNGGHNRLFRNLGDGRFEDVTERTGCDSTRWTLAAASADLDGDGWPDLYLANDYGPEELFLNRGGERFERASGVGLEETSKSGMCVALGDFENSGQLGVFVTNISQRRFLFQGNNLRVNRLATQRRLYNIADATRTVAPAFVDCGWAWGAQFGDLDNDGRQDLFVVNGFISASRERDYWYGMSKVATGTGGLFEDAANWPPIGEASLSGYERSRVLLNRGNQRFDDVGEAAGVSDTYDGRGVALADLSNRGALDAIVANQKGPLLVYRGEPDPANHWVQFRLVGSASNASAIGASLELVFGGRTQVQVVQAGSGFASQNDRRLHFGLGRDPSIERARIRWPSGRVQEIEAPAADRLHVVEEPR